MIYETTREAIREGMEKSGLRLNLLRICARAPRTIHQLIHAPRYPGIEMDLFSLQSEINVTVELGECKNRGLLVAVGRVPDPIVPGGMTELLRTTLLAFLLSPRLSRAEPAAYWLYMSSWCSRLGEGWRGTMALMAAFPELASRAFYARAGPGVDDPYFQGDPRRVFGCYHIRDLPTQPKPFGPWQLWHLLAQPPLGEIPPRALDGLPRPLAAWCRLRARRHRESPGPQEDIAPLTGPELFPGRLAPMPLTAPRQRSSTRSPS